jgi:twitching motility two-component system response regulator PilG
MPQTQDALLLRDAVTAAKAGDKPAARQLLRQASVHNPNNELVWLWRASLSETPKEAIFYLGEVLRINPGNQKASAWMDRCKGQNKTATAEEPRPGGQGFSQPHVAESNATPTATAGPGPSTQTVLRVAEQVGTSTVPVESSATASVVVDKKEIPVALRSGEVPAPNVREPAARPKPAVASLTSSPAPAPPGADSQQQQKWRCPFCKHGSDATLRRCPTCRAVTILEDLKEVEKNEGVQERVVRDALARYESTPAEKRNFDQNLSLALGHLNLREATAALPYLKAAASQKKSDWALLGVLDQIQWRKVILVVDDSLTIRKALSSILEKNDFRVVTAEDGSQALAKLNEAVPDLVLLDITMPWMDGYEVCKAIKSKALTRKVPVVMLSGKDGLFDKVRGKLAGCNDYVTKPFDPDGLLKTIKKYIS